jgi:4-hydroxy-3-polyprenylbenzoate decarboxylase
VHLSISPAARDVVQQELNIDLDLHELDEELDDDQGLFALSSEFRNTAISIGQGNVNYYHYQDFMAPMASGSFLTAGMVICPCSGATLSAVATGASTNLIHRAAEVHLKERRKLILVPRETPLSLPHIDNMRRAAEAGAIILPASPGFYHGVESVNDLVDFVVGRICDQLGIKSTLIKRWGTIEA